MTNENSETDFASNKIATSFYFWRYRKPKKAKPHNISIPHPIHAPITYINFFSSEAYTCFDPKDIDKNWRAVLL